ncbi:hypothetical protein JZ751_014815 [Albula glossodonta]|uniref:Uncharacterized protein n=1 Tax=Albula glossodonta TaxID=121402 RepID=A0A8T2MYQ0_9TELE|nr:hypothetical protein JZ751_014815 [Albula glossodonta]
MVSLRWHWALQGLAASQTPLHPALTHCSSECNLLSPQSSQIYTQTLIIKRERERERERESWRQKGHLSVLKRMSYSQHYTTVCRLTHVEAQLKACHFFNAASAVASVYWGESKLAFIGSPLCRLHQDRGHAEGIVCHQPQERFMAHRLNHPQMKPKLNCQHAGLQAETSLLDQGNAAGSCHCQQSYPAPSPFKWLLKMVHSSPPTVANLPTAGTLLCTIKVYQQRGIHNLPLSDELQACLSSDSERRCYPSTTSSQLDLLTPDSSQEDRNRSHKSWEQRDEWHVRLKRYLTRLSSPTPSALSPPLQQGAWDSFHIGQSRAPHSPPSKQPALLSAVEQTLAPCSSAALTGPTKRQPQHRGKDTGRH